MRTDAEVCAEFGHIVCDGSVRCPRCRIVVQAGRPRYQEPELADVVPTFLDDHTDDDLDSLAVRPRLESLGLSGRDVGVC